MCSVVLGGGSGFGAAIARRFGEEGAKVIVADINTEGGEKVASQNPANLIFQRVDVTQAEEWKTVTDLAFSKFGRLDVLVNNAGTTYRNKVREFEPPAYVWLVPFIDLLTNYLHAAHR